MLDKRSLREQIRDTLLQRIGGGELAPGERITEVKLARELGVSSIPVREALRELVAIGALESVAHKGVWVREVKHSERIEALQVRAALEALAISLAAPELKKRRAELRALAKAIVTAARARDFLAFQKHNQAFHRTLVEGANNRVLLKFWDMLAFEVGARPILESVPEADVMTIARQHEQILGALETGDIGKEATLLSAHSMHLVECLEDGSPAKPGADRLRVMTAR